MQWKWTLVSYGLEEQLGCQRQRTALVRRLAYRAIPWVPSEAMLQGRYVVGQLLALLVS